MSTTIKVSEETKERMKNLDLAGKGKSYDMMINDLITSYEQKHKNHAKSMKQWKRDMAAYEKNVEAYKKRIAKFDKEEESWKRLMKWAKTKGFKG